MAVRSLILGHSGVGKTTLIYSILISLQSDILNTIQGTYKTDLATIDLKEQIKQIETRMRNNANFGTTNSSQYLFKLSYLNNLISDFCLFDYRGGVLDHQSSDENELNNLRMILGSSSVVLMMIDLSDSNLENRLIANLNEILLSLRTRPRSLVIYLVPSKVDLYGSKEKVEKYIRGSIFANKEIKNLLKLIFDFSDIKMLLIPIINKTGTTKASNVDALIHHMFSYKTDYLIGEATNSRRIRILRNFKERLKKAYFRDKNISFIRELKKHEFV